jgi:hypothetical protein
VVIVDPVAEFTTVIRAKIIPRSGRGVCASVSAPIYARLISQNLRKYERSDIDPYTIIDVRVPAYWLSLKWFPANEDVIWAFALDYRF